MHSFAKGLAGAGIATLLAASGSAVAQEEGQNAQNNAMDNAPSEETMAMIEELPEQADQYLWCASAFALIASVSQDQQEAQGLSGLSQQLVARARQELGEDEYSQEDFDNIASGYTQTVLEEFEAQDQSAMRYTPDECLTFAGVTEQGGNSSEPQGMESNDSDMEQSMDEEMSEENASSSNASGASGDSASSGSSSSESSSSSSSSDSASSNSSSDSSSSDSASNSNASSDSSENSSSSSQ